MALKTDCIGKSRNRRKGDEIDGPYAWLIAIASFMAHVMIYGIVWCSGIFYDIFREVFHEGSGIISLIATLSTAFTFGFSPLTGILINKFGHRVITMLGGLIAGISLILSSYATNIYFLAVTFGVLAGIGFGIAYLPSISIVPLYFEKWRTVALGVAVSGAGCGVFVYPPLIRFLVNVFGMRGSLLIIGGITLNICLCGAFMRVPRVRAKLLVKSQSIPSKELTSESDCTSSSTELSRSSNSPLDVSRKVPERKKSCIGLFNLHIFRNSSYIVFCFNNLLLMFGMSVVIVHLAAYSETKGITKDTAAMLVSAIGISNLIGRLLFGLLGKMPCFSALTLYMGSLLAGGLAVIVLPFMQTLVGILAFTSLFGFMTASIGPLIPQLITEFLSIGLIPSGYGYLLVFEAIGSLLGPPAAGYVYEKVQIYAASFYLGGACLAASGVVMIIPYVRHKLTTRSPASNLEIVSKVTSSDIKEDLSNA